MQINIFSYGYFIKINLHYLQNLREFKNHSYKKAVKGLEATA